MWRAKRKLFFDVIIVFVYLLQASSWPIYWSRTTVSCYGSFYQVWPWPLRGVGCGRICSSTSWRFPWCQRKVCSLYEGERLAWFSIVIKSKKYHYKTEESWSSIKTKREPNGFPLLCPVVNSRLKVKLTTDLLVVLQAEEAGKQQQHNNSQYLEKIIDILQSSPLLAYRQVMFTCVHSSFVVTQSPVSQTNCPFLRDSCLLICIYLCTVYWWPDVSAAWSLGKRPSKSLKFCSASIGNLVNASSIICATCGIRQFNQNWTSLQASASRNNLIGSLCCIALIEQLWLQS